MDLWFGLRQEMPVEALYLHTAPELLSTETESLCGLKVGDESWGRSRRCRLHRPPWSGCLGIRMSSYPK